MYPQIIDRYGNYWASDSNGNLVDDLGRTPVIKTQSGNVTYYDVLASNGPINNNGKRVRYTVITSPVSISTNFGISPYVQDWNGTLSPVQSIQLPDGTSYIFTYDSYGEVSSVILPTGGVISYGYTNATDATGTVNRWVSSRMVGSGSPTTYTLDRWGTRCGNPCSQTILLHKPSGDETIYSLYINNGDWLTGVDAYTGSAGSIYTAPTVFVQNAYNFTAVPITKSGTNIIHPDTLMESQTLYSYSNPQLGQLGSVKQWDYYAYESTPSAAPTEETDYTYSGYDLQQVAILDSNGNPAAKTIYGYYGSPSTITEGIIGHGASPTVTQYLHTVSQWLDTGSSLTTTYNYDDTGTLVSVSDPKTNSTMLTYQCSNAYPYQVTNALNQTTTYGYDCNSGAVTSVKDPNDLAANRSGTTYSYESTAGRLQYIKSPDGGQTSYSYPSATEIDTSILATPDPTIAATDLLDAYGRPSQHTQAGATTATSYDGNGRVACITNPHAAGASSTDGSTCISAYDGLDRPTLETLPDSSTVSWSYTGNTVTYSDQASNSWQRTTNAFGQLTSVVEPGGFQTGYSYDALGNLLCIEQHGGVSGTGCSASRRSDASSAWRIRRFTYDWLSRLTSVNSPEAGTILYSYVNLDGITLCSGTASEPCSKTDERLVTTTYSYDALNRLHYKNYSDGTLTAGFGYDGLDEGGSSIGGWATNTIGRLTRVSNETSAFLGFSYDAMGRVNAQLDYVPSGYVTHSTQYDLAGNPTQLTYPDGYQIQQTYNSAGQLVSSSLDAINGTSASQSYLQSASYFPDGSPNIITLGNGVQQTVAKNNRLQVQSLAASTPLAPFNSQPFLSHSYCYVNCPTGGTANNGDIWQITDSLKAANTQGYTYDSLNRITGFSIGDVANQAYQPDPFGNLTLTNSGGAVNTFASNNHISNLTCQGPGGTASYDSSGNQLCDGDSGLGTLHQYSFDAEGRMSSVSNGSSTIASYIYGGNGTRVRKSNADGTYTDYVYSGGQPIAERHADGTWTDNIYANGQLIAKTASSDTRLHLSGTTVQAGYELASEFSVPSGIVVTAGDKISWRQYNNGGGVGGINLFFSNGGSMAWHTIANDGWAVNQNPTQNVWEYRTAALDEFSGTTITGMELLKDVWTTAGNWSIYIGDICIVRTDGTVIPISTTGQASPNALQTTNPSYDTSFNVVSETVSLSVDPTYTAASAPTHTTKYYLGDHLGSTNLEFSAGGWPVWQEQYTPFGQEINPQSTSNNYKYAGMEGDSESGLDHTQFRQLSSVSTRWMSPDPYLGSINLTNPQTLNRYAYVRNNPMIFRDPKGLDDDDDDNCDIDPESCGGSTGGDGGSDPTGGDSGGGAPGGGDDSSGGVAVDDSGTYTISVNVVGIAPLQTTVDVNAAQDFLDIPGIQNLSGGLIAPMPSLGFNAVTAPSNSPKNGSFPWGWPFNGNMLPLKPGTQDNKCTTGPLEGSMDRNPAVLSCCQAHDNCYSANQCNATSWIPNPLPSGACNVCNAKAAACITGAVLGH